MSEKTDIPTHTQTELPVETNPDTPINTPSTLPAEPQTELPLEPNSEPSEPIPPLQKESLPKKTRKSKILFVFLMIIGILGPLFLFMELGGFILSKRNRVAWPEYLRNSPIDSPTLAKMAKENTALQKRLSRTAPRGIYLIIDTASNILYIKKGQETIRQVVVSCGSGNILQEPSGKRTWIFDTPRGEFKVVSKLKKPVWVKPDWAFIEEGKAIPDDREERLEPGVMGDYAMGFGDGYFVHGTLYTRLLGRNVTHGCVRVGDDDLKNIFKAVAIGTTLFIF